MRDSSVDHNSAPVWEQYEFANNADWYTQDADMSDEFYCVNRKFRPGLLCHGDARVHEPARQIPRAQSHDFFVRQPDAGLGSSKAMSGVFKALKKNSLTHMAKRKAGVYTDGIEAKTSQESVTLSSSNVSSCRGSFDCLPPYAFLRGESQNN